MNILLLKLLNLNIFISQPGLENFPNNFCIGHIKF